jgi:small-conductance mechanosensitive channel
MEPSADSGRTWRIVLVPAVITLAITLLRLVGELQHWSPRLFNAAPGGGGSVVGISWLVPLFGIYFGLRLARDGERPRHVGIAVLLLVAAVALVPLSGFVAGRLGLDQRDLRMLLVFAFASVIAVAVALRAWPALGRVLLAYALAARIPVALLMLVAMVGNWGTHYDAAPPDFPAMSAITKWLWIGALPQLTIWIAYTVVIGGVFGLVAGAIAARRRREPSPAAA